MTADRRARSAAEALSQVFRFYAKHAKQLTQVLFDFATKQCFPWEACQLVRPCFASSPQARHMRD